MAQRESHDVGDPAKEECVGRHHENADALLRNLREAVVNLALAAGAQNDKLKSQTASRILDIDHVRLSDRRVSRIDEECNGARGGNQIMRQAKSLCAEQ